MKASTNKWHPFDRNKGYKQGLPPEKRYVLVQTAEQEAKGLPPGVAVGYLKFAAGDKQCPYFVIPGIGGEVTHWNDCLGDEFKAPMWAGEQRKST